MDVRTCPSWCWDEELGAWAPGKQAASAAEDGSSDRVHVSTRSGGEWLARLETWQTSGSEAWWEASHLDASWGSSGWKRRSQWCQGQWKRPKSGVELAGAESSPIAEVPTSIVITPQTSVEGQPWRRQLPRCAAERRVASRRRRKSTASDAKDWDGHADALKRSNTEAREGLSKSPGRDGRCGAEVPCQETSNLERGRPSKWDINKATRPVATPLRSTLRQRGLGLWDEQPNVDVVTAHVLMASRLANLGPKRRRELYVGNLAVGKVTEHTLRTAFMRLFQCLPAYIEAYSDSLEPIRSVTWPCSERIPRAHQEMFAFVEFFDDVVTNTALKMTGFDLCDRPVKIGRPSAADTVETQSASLDVTPLREAGLLPKSEDDAIQRSKLRELYIGNLNDGQVTETMIRQLVDSICVELQEFEPQKGLPTKKIVMSATKSFCFVEVQNENMASRLIPVLHNTKLCGRHLKVGRPANLRRGVKQDTLAAVKPPPPAPPIHSSTVRESGMDARGTYGLTEEPQHAGELSEISSAFLAGAAAVAKLGI